MRILLNITALLLVFSVNLSAQSDFKTLDQQTYNYYIKGDYKNLKNTADTMLSHGMDYYYLRMRLGILAYNKQLYSSILKNFTRAMEFNSIDTISREYIYFSYLFSGRKADAYLYLESVPKYKKNNILKSIGKPGLSSVYAGSSASGSDVTLYKTNNLYYEAVKSSLSFNAGFESYFSARFKGTFAYTNYHKTGTVYSVSDTSGIGLNFTQHQLYAKLNGYIFPGWEFSGFGHVAFYPYVTTQTQTNIEYLGGLGIAKNGWKIRTGANLSFSNFSNSNQIRGEGYLTYLPFANLNLYFTSGGMYQSDKYWGGTYQINQEIGFKISKSIWLESGIIKGNSFLYARNQGYMINNSFQIPETTIYSNIILLPDKKFSITISPYYCKNQIYSWNLNSYLRTNKLNINSFGVAFKLTCKIK
ncbi:MAG: hypothetical protein NT144_10030 [Bacteroidia bacterium]|nr:hypothetical protein [Bacteroidia bacterium]